MMAPSHAVRLLSGTSTDEPTRLRALRCLGEAMSRKDTHSDEGSDTLLSKRCEVLVSSALSASVAQRAAALDALLGVCKAPRYRAFVLGSEGFDALTSTLAETEQSPHDSLVTKSHARQLVSLLLVEKASMSRRQTSDPATERAGRDPVVESIERVEALRALQQSGDASVRAVQELSEALERSLGAVRSAGSLCELQERCGAEMLRVSLSLLSSTVYSGSNACPALLQILVCSFQVRAAAGIRRMRHLTAGLVSLAPTPPPF